MRLAGMCAGLFAAALGGSNLCRAAEESAAARVQRILEELNRGSDGKTPTVKNFSADWVATLDQRGEPKVYTRENSKAFEYIGMPVGGIGTGLLYLGGDGKLWGWDLFNTKGSGQTRQEHAYRNPYARSDTNNPAYYSLQQGFAVRLDQDGKTTTRTLDRDGFKDIRFRGEYPVGRVAYADPDCPVQVELEAFSPFCPINLDDSTYPATVLIYIVRNTSAKPVSGELLGWLQNAVCIDSGKEKPAVARRKNRVVQSKALSLVEYTAGLPPAAGAAAARPDILFVDFEQEKYSGWTATGTAFGAGPVAKTDLPPYLAAVAPKGQRAVVSHNTRQGEGIGAADAHQGTLTSREFTIERKLICFLIGGGAHPGQTGLNLLVEGKVVQSATGRNSNDLRQETFDVSKWQGQKARLEIMDAAGGDWGNISVDQIVFCDALPDASGDWLTSRHDYGSMVLALAERKNTVRATADFLPPQGAVAGATLEAERLCGEPPPVGALARTFKLKPGAEVTVRFVLAWYFPNYRREALRTSTDRSYGTRFTSARQVAETVAGRLEPLTVQTRLWHDTWYDATLPWWFLDRTFLNACILASNTSYLFGDGRFFGYEGEYLGYGTCTHVWGYVQAMGRLFPALERSLREQVEYNPKVGFDAKTGGIGQRAEQCLDPADDGQASVILRTLLTHQMQPDNRFLAGIYPRMKQAMNFLVNDQDPDRDGIMTNDQMNTLDARWYGKIAWLSLHYQAALRAAAAMGDVMQDSAAATEWRAIAERGRKYIETSLFNGEYFFQEADPAHARYAQGSYDGCEIDQLLGQSWARQVGLGTIVDPAKAAKALDSLWRYNLTTDIGPYRKEFPKGRWFAMPGEGGFFICTWPRGCPDFIKQSNDFFTGYMSELMSGFEYALSSLMMWDGMPYRSLTHTRLMCERYDAAKRNPWNEVEWGSFYARAMASYGVFTAACGFEYDGPAGYIAFAPRLTPDQFKAAFTVAEGWGSYSQKSEVRGQRTELTATLALKYGRLRLKTIGLAVGKPDSAQVFVKERSVPSQWDVKDGKVLITLAQDVNLSAGDTLRVVLR